MPRLRYAGQEQFVVILLDTKNKVIGTETVSVGSLTSAIVHPREVFSQQFYSMLLVLLWHIIILREIPSLVVKTLS